MHVVMYVHNHFALRHTCLESLHILHASFQADTQYHVLFGWHYQIMTVMIDHCKRTWSKCIFDYIYDILYTNIVI